MRLVASAIVVLAGANCIGLAGSGGVTSYTTDANTTGVALLLIGGVCFAIEFFRTWKGHDRKPDD